MSIRQALRRRNVLQLQSTPRCTHHQTAPPPSYRLSLSPSSQPLLFQARMSSSSPSADASLSSAIQSLLPYSACDIADALLALEPKPSKPTTAPRAGFLANITPAVPSAHSPKTIAPAFTVLFHSKHDPSTNPNPDPASQESTPSNIPASAQWSDLIQPNTIVVVAQPSNQYNAVVGGHHATRLARLGATGILVSGRVRDMADLKALGLPIWASGTSVVGAGAESKAHAVQVPVDVGGVVVRPGDLVFCDPDEGAVRIPEELVGKLVEWLPGHARKEAEVKRLVEEGWSVREAFEKGRGGK